MPDKDNKTLEMFRMYIEEEEAAFRARNLPINMSLSSLHIDENLSDQERKVIYSEKLTKAIGSTLLSAVTMFDAIPFKHVAARLVKDDATGNNIRLDIEIEYH